MAEAVGVALGVVALLSTFKDCIDLFSTISATKSFGADYEILNTKLDIEKFLLLQWVDRMRLAHSYKHDSRLNNTDTNTAVLRILVSIKVLLSESTRLQDHYGLKQVDSDSAIVPAISEVDSNAAVVTAISGSRMNDFTREVKKLSLHIDTTQKTSSFKKRLCWVVKDKERFSGLIQELSNFISKLNAVVPELPGQADYETTKDLQSIRSLYQVQLVLEAAKEYEVGVANLAQEVFTQRCQERLLERLWYRKIDERKSNVAEPHLKTLQWALYPPTPDVAWDSLSEWLTSGFGVYWVSGKAGSGKSTLMKYLYQSTNVRTKLETWAGMHRLVLANFFFWNIGSQEQQTQDSLCRGLLYCVLKADPSLIPDLLPDMWREAQQSFGALLELPGLSEMVDAFTRLCSIQSQNKFCFFIDGLDEYAGSHTDAVAFVNKLVSGDNIKVIVSSRPITACVEGFSSKPKLQLQDLTRDDMKVYVNDTIGSHPHLCFLKSRDSKIVEDILSDLVGKASGVFLWVVLACRSLLEGFAAGDYPAELQQRVTELPAELQSLFAHILERIESRYRVHAAKLLRICHQRQIYLNDGRHDGWSQDGRFVGLSEGIYTLGLAMVDEHAFDSSHVPMLNGLMNDEKWTKCKMLEARLRSRCCGLLEIQHGGEPIQRCFCGCPHEGASKHQRNILIDSMVGFLHRSVFEFLNDPEVWELDCLQIPDDGFDANSIVFSMNLHLASIVVTHDNGPEQFNELMIEALLCAITADKASCGSAATMLFTFSHFTLGLIEEWQHTQVGGSHPFLAAISQEILRVEHLDAQLASVLAAECGMTNTLEHLYSLGILARTTTTPLLAHAIDRPYSGWLLGFGLELHPGAIESLLAKRYDPNATFESSARKQTTPWKSWLHRMSITCTENSWSEAAEITELFIRGGADLGVQLLGHGSSVENVIERRLLNHARRDTIYSPATMAKDRAMKGRCQDLLQLLETERRRNKTGGHTTEPLSPYQLADSVVIDDKCKKRSESTLQAESAPQEREAKRKKTVNRSNGYSPYEHS